MSVSPSLLLREGESLPGVLAVTRYCRLECYTLKENGFLGCGQSLLCELKSRPHEHLAYTDRLKSHNSFLNFGPAETAACVPALGLTAKVSRFFCHRLLKSTGKGKCM